MNSEETPQTLSLTLKRKTRDVQIEQEDGQMVAYRLIELTGTGRATFLNFYNKHVTMTRLPGQDKVQVEVKDHNGLFSYLLALTLQNTEGKLLPQTELDKWPAETLRQLFMASQELSGLTTKGDEEAKNA